MAAGRGFFKYLKKAFLHHWNLLALAAGAAVGFISGRPDVVLPIVVAAEMVYLAGLSTRPRFQAAVDAEEHKEAKVRNAEQSAEKSRLILESLKNEDRKRFESLRSLCLQLQRIAKGVKGQTDDEKGVIDDLQASGVNRLLWIYLKLLYSKNALERFFFTINEREIERKIEKAKKRLEAIGPPESEGETPGRAKRRKLLQDTLTTLETRLENYVRAQENHEFIELELERLYSKIASLGEMGINRQDPDSITSEVDSVSASVQQTEKAMGELEFLTGLSAQDDAPPELLLEVPPRPETQI